MFKQKNTGSPDNVDTLIGANTVIEGNIESQGTIRVDGTVKGDIRVDGDIYVGNSATISGNVEATNVTLSGMLEGNVTSNGMLRVLSTARLYGDIQVHSFVADEGAIFQGKCSMIEVSAADNALDTSDKSSSKKTRTSKDYKKSTVLDQLYEEKQKNDELIS